MNFESCYIDVMMLGFLKHPFSSRNRKVKPSVQTVLPLRMKGTKVRGWYRLMLGHSSQICRKK